MEKQNKKINVKAMDNLTDAELKDLIVQLKKIDGFEFFVSSACVIQ
ncbi:MAG: hypothetical protein ABI340_06870 [Nitrososphaera sp.]|jgi:hypothetical protein